MAALGRAAALLEAQADRLWPQLHLRRAAVRELVGQIEGLQDAALHDAAGQHPCGDALARAVVRLRWWAITFLNELKDSPGQAIAMARSLAADEERALGGDHPETLSARDNLAVTCRIAGHTDEAITLHEQTLAARERTLGTEHPDTLTSRNNLALAYRTAGRTDEAITLLEQTLAARERTLGAEHRSTLASRNNLALAYRTAGRTDEAIALHQQTLAARERTLGTDHPDTLTSRNNLARAYRTAGRTDEAITLHQQTLAARERTLGTEHPDTLTSRDNLARAYRTAGRTGEAIALEQTLAARADRSGRDRVQPLMTGVEEMVVFLSAKGWTPGEVTAHLSRVYGVEVSTRSAGAITDRAMDGMAQWRNRPLRPAYEVIFVDTTRVKIRADGPANLPVHVALGVTAQGERDVLGLWPGEHGDGGHTESWRRALSEIKSRGTREVGIVVGDGIEGLPEAVSAVWVNASVTASVVHRLRKSPLSLARRASKRDWSEMVRDLKPVYLAGDEADALDRFAEFAAKWAARYPTVVRLCQDAWPELLAFLRWDQRTRAMITTNAIETLNARFGRSVRARGRFPSEQAALGHLYLVVTHLDPTGRAAARWTNRWRKALPALDSRPVSAPSARRSWQAPSRTPATARVSTADPTGD